MKYKSKVIFSVDSKNYFFIAIRQPFRKICTCLETALILHTNNKNTPVFSGNQLLTVLEGFKYKLIEALLGKLEIPEPLALVRYKAHIHMVGLKEALSSDKEYSAVYDWALKYRLCGVENGAGSSIWLETRDQNVIISVFSNTNPLGNDTPLKTFTISYSKAREWIVCAQKIITLMQVNDSVRFGPTKRDLELFSTAGIDVKDIILSKPWRRFDACKK